MAEAIAVILVAPPSSLFILLMCWYVWIEIQREREP